MSDERVASWALKNEILNAIDVLRALESHRYGKRVSESDAMNVLLLRALEQAAEEALAKASDDGRSPIDDVPYSGDTSLGEAMRHAQNRLLNPDDLEYWREARKRGQEDR